MSAWPRCIASTLVAVCGGFAASTVQAQVQSGMQPDDGRDEIAVREPPRLSRTDVPNLPVQSQPGSRTDLTELSYRRWASSGRASVGIGFGSITLTDRPVGTAPLRDTAPTAIASGSVMMLGLHYRATDSSSFYADASRVSGLGGSGDDPQVVGKVGMEFKAARSQWNVAYGGLGFRMAGDARMTVKLRRGGVGLFMRSAF